jgi:hypothetical protein
VTVDAVDGEKADPTRHDRMLNRLYEKKTLVLEIVGSRRGKEKHRPAARAVCDDRHLKSEAGASPSVQTTRQSVVYELHADFLALT